MPITVRPAAARACRGLPPLRPPAAALARRAAPRPHGRLQIGRSWRSLSDLGALKKRPHQTLKCKTTYLFLALGAERIPLQVGGLASNSPAPLRLKSEVSAGPRRVRCAMLRSHHACALPQVWPLVSRAALPANRMSFPLPRRPPRLLLLGRLRLRRRLLRCGLLRT